MGMTSCIRTQCKFEVKAQIDHLVQGGLSQRQAAEKLAKQLTELFGGEEVKAESLRKKAHRAEVVTNVPKQSPTKTAKQSTTGKRTKNNFHLVHDVVEISKLSDALNKKLNLAAPYLVDFLDGNLTPSPLIEKQLDRLLTSLEETSALVFSIFRDPGKKRKRQHCLSFRAIAGNGGMRDAP